MTNSILYFLFIGVLCILTFLLNYYTIIYQCALIFTIITIVINISTSIYGKLKTLKGLAFALMVSFCLLWKSFYYIDGKIINGMILVSFISLMISMYWSTTIFSEIQGSFFSFAKSNFISLWIGTIIDEFIMGMFFVMNSNFSYIRFENIFIREVSYKIIYGLIASVIIHIILNILKNNSNTKTNNYLKFK